MAESKTVTVLLERPYSRGDSLYSAGALVEVPKEALPGILEAKPPYGREVGDQELDVLTDPDATVNATDSAAALAEEHGFDLRARAGSGSGDDGRIVKADVEGWLTA